MLHMRYVLKVGYCYYYYYYFSSSSSSSSSSCCSSTVNSEIFARLLFREFSISELLASS